MQKEPAYYNLGAAAVGKDHRTQKTHITSVKFALTSTFNDVRKKLNEVFQVQDGKYIRVGKLKNPGINTFNGLDLGTYLKTNALYPSHVKLYLETDEKFTTVDGQGDGDAPAEQLPVTDQPAATPENVTTFTYNFPINFMTIDGEVTTKFT